MQIKLLNLSINNFKGIKKFILDADGKSIIVQGKNGTGKTSLADAWYWLLTGSNSDGQSKYNIIELDDGSVPVDHQNAEVTAVIQADGKKIELKKVYRQVWRKKRGQADAEFGGHTTKHSWDSVAVSAKEYQSRLDELCPAAVIRSLTDVHHFCDRMKADDRRQELISIAGEINMQSICAQYSELNELPELIGDYSLIDFEKMLKSQRKEAQESLKYLPVEINSKREELPDLDDMDETEIRSNIAKLDEQISGIKNELVALANGLRSTELRKEKMDLEAGLIDLENKARQKAIVLKHESSDLYRHASDNEYEIDRLKKDAILIQKKMEENREQDAQLVAAWKGLKLGGKTCLTCGQQLPHAEIEKHLDNIAKRGGKLAEEYEQLAVAVNNIDRDIKNLGALIKIQTKEAESIAQKSQGAQIIPGKAEIEGQIASLAEVIEKEVESIGPEKERLEAALSELEIKVGREREKLLSITQAEKTQDRIRQKEKALKLAAAEFEECERKLFLLELYGRKRSEYIEETVSQKFEITSWKLFEEQINAGSREICEPVYGGVPYSTDLNTGAKIQVGLDVIRTLSRHHGVTMPVFIDNAESVTSWMIDMDNQMIRLQAMPNVEKLEVIDG